MLEAREDWCAEHYARDFYWGCYFNGQAQLYADTTTILWSWCNEGDDPDFAWLVKLSDGSFASVQGGHDTTGWDCVSSLDLCHVGASARECARFFTEEPRRAWEQSNGAV